MIINIYSIYDKKAEAFGQPFYQHNHELARRSVIGAAKHPESLLGVHPLDFDVYYLGAFNDENGVITQVSPQHLFNVVDLLKKDEQ